MRKRLKRTIAIVATVLILSSTGLLYSFYKTLLIPSCGKKVTDEALLYYEKVGDQLEAWLDQTGETLAIIGRKGQDLEKHGMVYSHLAFVKKEAHGWFVYHLLNACPTDVGELHRENLAHFFKVTNAPHSVSIVIPERDIQAKLSTLLDNPDAIAPLFEADYSAVASPFNAITQNSNGWILEVYAKALDPNITTRRDAANFLRTADYQPMALYKGAFYQWVSKTFIPNITLKDHDAENLKAGRIEFNSAESVMQFIARKSLPISHCTAPFEAVHANACEVKNAPAP